MTHAEPKTSRIVDHSKYNEIGTSWKEDKNKQSIAGRHSKEQKTLLAHQASIFDSIFAFFGGGWSAAFGALAVFFAVRVGTDGVATGADTAAGATTTDAVVTPAATAGTGATVGGAPLPAPGTTNACGWVAAEVRECLRSLTAFKWRLSWKVSEDFHLKLFVQVGKEHLNGSAPV